MSQGRDGRGRARAGHAAAAAEPGAGRQGGDASSPRSAASRVPSETRVLLAPLEGVGRDYPLSIEKLCPVLSYYVVKDWREGCERCKQILRYGGMGHTMSIHSQNDADHSGVRPQEAGVPDRRQLADDARVDRPDDRAGSGDDARMRRLRRQHHVGQHLAPASAEHQAAGVRDHARLANRFERSEAAALGRDAPRLGIAAPVAPAPASLPDALEHARIDAFLGSRGYSAGRRRPARCDRSALEPVRLAGAARTPLDFVCEEDVRLAIKAGTKLLVSERAIITPAARELGEQHRLFTAVTGKTGCSVAVSAEPLGLIVDRRFSLDGRMPQP